MTLTEFAAKRSLMDQDSVWIFEPGIMQFPYDAKNWDGRASTWFTRHEILNDRCDYFCTPIGRAFHQQKRIARAIRTLDQYRADGRKLKIVCHSNGDAIITAALGQMNWPRIEELHIFSGAGPADFQKCGFNNALEVDRIGKLLVYIAGKDRALLLASTFLGRWLGYGTLGRSGPQNMSTVARQKVQTITEPDYGHSTWFDPANFDKTMRRILAP